MEKGRGGQGRAGQGRAELQHSQAVQLFSMTILHDLRVILCVCSEGSSLFHIMLCFLVKAIDCVKDMIKLKR